MKQNADCKQILVTFLSNISIPRLTRGLPLNGAKTVLSGNPLAALNNGAHGFARSFATIRLTSKNVINDLSGGGFSDAFQEFARDFFG